MAVAWAYGVKEIAWADEDDDSPGVETTVRARSESLTLVDVVDLRRWRPDTLVVSPDGTRMAYVLFDGPSGRIVIDGRAGTSYAGFGTKPVFSADSRHVAYLAMNAQKLWFVVADGIESREKYSTVQGHAGVFPNLQWSLDGRELAYISSVDANGALKQVVVADHVEGRKYDEIAGLAMDPKGERVAYAARTGNQWAVVVDGKEGPRHDGVLATSPVFSPDGRHVAYGAQEGRRFFVVIDGKRGRDYDNLGGALLFAPDSKRLVYAPGVGRRRAVVVGDEELGLFERVDDGSFAFSRDGRHLAFKAGDATSWFVVVDGNKGLSYRGVGRPVFMPDGRVAHSACDQCGGTMEAPAQFVVVGGRRIGAAYADIADPIVGSSDGRRVAFVAKRGAAAFVVVDSREQRSYASIVAQSLRFSPDGQDLVYAASIASGKYVVVDSDQEGTAFDAVGLRGSECAFPVPSQYCGWRFERDGSFAYLAWQRDRVYLVRSSPRSP